MLKLVIFDMDGLLFDTEVATCRGFMDRAAAWGFSPSKEQYVQCLGKNGKGIQQLFREFFGEDIDAVELYRQVGERRMEILEEEGLMVKKGVRELLDFLEEKGVPKVVASGSDIELIKTYVGQTGLDGRFEFLMSTDQVKRGKPYPDVFLEICSRVGVKPEETLVLEDAVNGVKAAVAGQIPVINVPDMIELPEELKKQCVAVVDSLLDAIPIVEEMLS